MSMESVNLELFGVLGGYRDFIVVGIGFNFGEDWVMRGNVSWFLLVV